MSGECDHERIFAGLRSSRVAGREQAIHDAYVDVHADALLARMLDGATRSTWESLDVAVHLGCVTGEAGDAALRRAISTTGRGTSDLRCASLLALAKRCREGAHDDYVHALGSTDAGTSGYAVLALAAFGRDGVWDDVAARLVSTMRRRNRRGAIPSDVVVPLVYLLRHAAGDPARIPLLVRTLRRHWAGLDPEHSLDREAEEWIARYWPDAAPGGPDPEKVATPDVDAIELWLRRNPLFATSP